MAPNISSFLLLASILSCAGLAHAFYTKSSPVLQLDSKNYDSLINWSNHSSIVEFYAPWCGHCQSLKPAYEKAAKNLAGLAKVAALNCDDEPNKMLCGQMGIKGFPTLKVVVPGSKPGKPRVEDYQGGRTAKAIVDAVVDKIPNHVKKLQDKDLDGWLSSSNDTAKVILFTDKGTTSALLRALAIDFLGSVSIAQVRQKEKAAIESFGIDKFPSLVLLPGGSKESILYDGEMKKEAIVKFLSQVASPNPDPAPKKIKAAKPSKSSKAAESPKSQAKASSASSAFSEASASQKSSDASEAAASASTIVLEDFDASESPKPIVPPVDHPLKVAEEGTPPLNSLFTSEELAAACLGPKTGTCVLALLPEKESREARFPEHVVRALQSLAELAEKHAKRKAKIFPFYAVHADNEAGKKLRDDLGLKTTIDLEIIAINGKRKWWRHFEGQDGSIVAVETFIDAIKLGEGKKQTLPASVIPQAVTKEAEHDEL